MLNSTADGYVALSVSEPLDDLSGFVEAHTIGLDGYSRQPVTYDRSQPLPTPGQRIVLTNTNAITWTSTAPWPAASTRAVAWVALFDQSTGAAENIYTGWAPINPARLINAAGITITIPAGTIKLTMGLEAY
jgi:hypothetical protein